MSSGVSAVTVNPPLPAGLSYVINPITNILTISGTPTVVNLTPSNFVFTTQGTCGSQVNYSPITFQVLPRATIVFSNIASTTQSVCQSLAINPITFTIGGGATGIVTTPLNGLTITPLGGGVYTIQGTPTNAGTNNIVITTTGSGCDTTASISITNVNSSVGITLTSGAGTDNQLLCQNVFNTPITQITYSIIGASNVVVSGLPAGLTATFSTVTNILTISGIPTQPGIFNYTITTSPCSIVKRGVIKVSTPMFITSETITDVACVGNLGSIAVTIIGGSPTATGQYAISWTGPPGFQQNQPTISGLEAGTYVLNVADALGCSLPPRSYVVQPAVAIVPISSTNINCSGALGTANFNVSGGSGIYSFTLSKFNTTTSAFDIPITPPFGNYFNITGLLAGRYSLTVTDSRTCSTTSLFNIYDYSSLSIDSIIMDDNLCLNNSGTIRIKVNSVDTNLTFYYNGTVVASAYLGFSIYELTIPAPSPTGTAEIKIINSQNCSIKTTVTTPIVTPNFTFTSSDFRAFGYYSVNGSVEFTNIVTLSNIPAEYAYIVWDFGDSTPYKVFRNPEDIPLVNGENFRTTFHTYTTNGIYQVTLTVYNHFGCSRKITKTIVIGTGASMMLPTIFTPNGDGMNDLFRPSLLGLKDVSMYIYDGWGNLVYEVSSEVSILNTDWGWNGIEKGQSEPKNNDYRYYIIATTIDDKKIEKEGRFLLVK